MRALAVAALAALLAFPSFAGPAFAQSEEPGIHIDWEVKNRFRLFKRSSDFQRHVAAARAGGQLAAEHQLENASGGRGWAQDISAASVRQRRGNPARNLRARRRARKLPRAENPPGRRAAHRRGAARRDLQLELRRRHHPAEAGERAVHRDRPAARRLRQADHRRGRYHPPRQQRRKRLDRNCGARSPDRGARRLGCRGRRQSRPAYRARRRRLLLPALPRRGARRIFPSEPRRLSGRQGLRGPAGTGSAATNDWNSQGARWMSAACHRSLYGYQIRTALTVAIENRHAAVTFIPLACSGATIDARPARLPGRKRLPADRTLRRHGARASRPACRRARVAPSAPTRTASSISCC